MTKAKTKRKFVKYHNRKLHESGEEKAYVTMSELLVIVAGGDEVEVVDDRTGEDITAFVLGRLIYDRCRSDKDAYDVEALRQIVMSSPPPKHRPVRDDEEAA